MLANKLIVLVAFLVAAALAAEIYPPRFHMFAAPNKTHDLIVGYRVPGDRLVLSERIVKNSGWMQVQTVQKTFNTSRFDTITQVRALDQKTNGNGAYASLLHGGPGFRNVTLKFKSQRGHSINFTVEIYARP